MTSTSSRIVDVELWSKDLIVEMLAKIKYIVQKDTL